MGIEAGADLPVALADVYAARERLKGITDPTPLLVSRELSTLAGGECWLKPECLQRTGSFKIRGAYNKMASLTPEERERGVITYSSGNHAQAVACSAALLGIRSLVVMPEDAVPAKVESTREYGAEVVFAGRDSLERQARAMELSHEHGYTVVPPFDDPYIIAGQGTCGLEIVEQLPTVDVVLAPCGGGGLLSGIALAIKALCPHVEVVGVEPEGAADAKASLAAGQITEVESNTVCDGLRTRRIGNLNFRVLRRYVDRIITIPDAAALSAMRFLALRARVVVEPSGAAAAAALLDGRFRLSGRRAVAVLSGGNLEPSRLASVLE